jgi:hypothetical protein
LDTKVNKLDETEGYYAKRNKPNTERQILHDLTCKWNLQKQRSEKQGERRREVKGEEREDLDQRVQSSFLIRIEGISIVTAVSSYKLYISKLLK